MINKAEAHTKLQNFIKLDKVQFACVVNNVHSDKGYEFNMKLFYATYGIQHQTTYVYTPQQNRIVERKPQHVLNVVHSLKFQCGISN